MPAYLVLAASLLLAAPRADVAAATPPAAAGDPSPPVGCIELVQGAPEGLADAEADIARGNLVLKRLAVRGSAEDDTLAHLLERRYGVHLVILPEDPEPYVQAYNERTWQAIESRLGPGAREALAAEARLIVEITTATGSRWGDAIDKAATAVAERDFAAGPRRLMRAGPVDPIEAVYDELLHARLGVDVPVVTDPDPGTRQFMGAFNKRMKQLLAGSLGQAALKSLAKDAVLEAATRDIAAGKLTLLLVGMPRPSDAVYQRLLRERFGIESRLIGCVPPEGLDLELYNQRMRQEIERRFGRGALEGAEDDARRLFEQQRPVGCLTAEEAAATDAALRAGER